MWTDVDQPAAEELIEVVRQAGLEVMDAEFVAQDRQRPAIVIRPGYVLILLSVPVFDKQTRVTQGAPLFLIVREQQLWTLHYQPIPPLARLLQEMEESEEKREEYFGPNALALALYVAGRMYDSAQVKLQRLAKQIDIAEDAIFHGNERKMVEEIAVLMRDVMDFRKVIRGQRDLFTTPAPHPWLIPEIESQWRRRHYQVMKLWEILEGLYEGMQELAATNNNLLQHKENELLRTLTYYSIISIPILVFVSPIAQRWAIVPAWQRGIYWGLLALLVAALLLIFRRSRKQRVL